MSINHNIKVGARRAERFIVEDRHTAKHVGSGSMRVLATPMMIAFMEVNTRKLLDELLPEGFSTVGVHVDVRHFAPSKQGNEVEARGEVLKLEGERVTLKIEVWDGDVKVGGGTHQRHIIEVARFMARVEASPSE